MKNRTIFSAPQALLAVALLALPLFAAETIRYADKDGTIHTAIVTAVIRDDLKNFRAHLIVNGRTQRVEMPTRFILEFRRGDPEDVNQWSKNLARASRLMAAGRLKTEGVNPGAEEIFRKIAYSTERGTAGQENTERIEPWHNKYAVLGLIEVHYRLGMAGDKAELDRALKSVKEFEDRSKGRPGSTTEMEVPAAKGTVKKAKVYVWGDTWLLPQVELYKARILAKLGKSEEAKKAYDDLVQMIKKDQLSPQILADAYLDQADLAAQGKPTADAEGIYRQMGLTLKTNAPTQPDAYGQGVLMRAANRALLEGADLLLKSAAEGKVTYDVPLNRYQELAGGAGSGDDALRIGAEVGIGVCQVELKKGEEAYKTLLAALAGGSSYPSQMARDLYYLGVAAPLFAQEIDKAGGKGDFLRAAGKAWWKDLEERYPTSPWAEKVSAK